MINNHLLLNCMEPNWTRTWNFNQLMGVQNWNPSSKSSNGYWLVWCLIGEVIWVRNLLIDVNLAPRCAPNLPLELRFIKLGKMKIFNANLSLTHGMPLKKGQNLSFLQYIWWSMCTNDTFRVHLLAENEVKMWMITFPLASDFDKVHVDICQCWYKSALDFYNLSYNLCSY